MKSIFRICRWALITLSSITLFLYCYTLITIYASPLVPESFKYKEAAAIVYLIIQIVSLITLPKVLDFRKPSHKLNFWTALICLIVGLLYLLYFGILKITSETEMAGIYLSSMFILLHSILIFGLISYPKNEVEVEGRGNILDDSI